MGKTTLAMIIANEMGWPMVDLIGSTAGNPFGLSKRLLDLKGKHIVFIDEIHALRKPVQEILYPVLEDGRLLYRRGTASAELPLPPITMIGATTDLGKLAQPFIDRFQLQFELHFYEMDELSDLGAITAENLGLGSIPLEILDIIAQRSRGTPRIMNQYLKWIRDFKILENGHQVDADYAEYVLWKRLRIDKLGLRPLDRNYLRVLAEVSTPIGVEAIGARLRQASITLENTVEPFLLYSRLIERVRSGRVITEEGRRHLAWLADRRKKLS